MCEAELVVVTFDAELWLWDARHDTWTFVTLPAEGAEDIRDLAAGPRRGFGSVRVRVTVGNSTWMTSIFPDSASGSFVLSVERVHDRFRAVSGAAIVAARFVPLGRTIGAGTAGLAGVPPAKFTIFSVVGVMLWVAWLTGLGFVTGAQTGWPVWASVATGMAVAIVVGLCVAVPEARVRRNASAPGITPND